jgi:hypothetical protein
VAEEAFNDFRALKLLESMSGRDAVLKMIDENLPKPVTFDNFPQSKKYIQDLRQKVNLKLKLQTYTK